VDGKQIGKQTGVDLLLAKVADEWRYPSLALRSGACHALQTALDVIRGHMLMWPGYE